MHIRNTLFFSVFLSSVILSPIRAIFTLEDFCITNAVAIGVGSVAKGFMYAGLNKINRVASKEYAIPLIGTVRFDINECAVESCALAFRSLAMYSFEKNCVPRIAKICRKETCSEGVFEDCTKKDLWHIVVVGARIAIAQLILAKRFDERLANWMIPKEQSPKTHRMFQIACKWAISTGIVCGSGFISHLVYPIDAKDFALVFAAFPCTTFADMRR